MSSATPAGSPDRRKRLISVAFLAVIAISAGIALPQALSSLPKEVPPSEPAKTASKEESAQKNPWSYTPPGIPDAPDARSTLIRLGLATAFVLALCVGTLVLGKRWLAGRSTPAAQGKHLRLLETLALGNRCTVHLVHVDERPVLIGVDSSGLRTLVPLPESFLDHALAATGEAEAGQGLTLLTDRAS